MSNHPPSDPRSGSRHQVGPDTVVHLSYELFDAEGELVEATDPEIELSFMFGYAQVSPKLEQTLDGLFAGDTRSVSLRAAEAFGHRDPAAIIEVARDELPDDVAVGDEFEAEHESGEGVSLTVLEVLDDRVVLDTNHPLAGQTVELRVTVQSVRPARADELAFAIEELEELKQLEESQDHEKPRPRAERKNRQSLVGKGDFGARGLLPAARLLRHATSPDDEVS